MHYHKNLLPRGLSESAEIQVHTIDYLIRLSIQDDEIILSHTGTRPGMTDLMIWPMVEEVFYCENIFDYKDMIRHDKYSKLHSWMNSMHELHAVNVTSVSQEKCEAYTCYMKTEA